MVFSKKIGRIKIPETPEILPFVGTCIVGIQGVSTQTCILHFALAGRNLQASFGLKVVWES